MKKYFLLALLLSTAIIAFAQFRIVEVQDERYTGKTYVSKQGYTSTSSTITAYGYGVSVSYEITGGTATFTDNWGTGANYCNSNDVAGFSEDFIVPVSSPVMLYIQLSNGSTAHWHIGYLTQ